MKQTLLSKGVPGSKVKIIPLWGRPELCPGPKSSNLMREFGIGESELVLLYAGNMGTMHPLDPLLDAAREVQKLPVRFIFVGDGVRRKHLVMRAQNENLQNIIFLPYQPEDRFARLVSTVDACFVVLEPGLEKLALPSRTFTFLSAGRPVVAFMSPDAEVARIVVENGCGWNVTDSAQLVDLIRYMLDHPDRIYEVGQKARRFYEKNFSREQVIAAYTKLLACSNDSPAV